MMGQLFMASVYEALAQSPHWENSLLVILYDENGGFYDHVPPPTAPDERTGAGFEQLGFRVPAFVAGPYVKEGYVSSIVRDHCSVLSHLTSLYELDPLSERVSWSPDLLDFIDLERLRAGKPRPPVSMPQILVDESEIITACAQKKPSQPELAALADAGFFAPEHDRRHLRRQDAYELIRIAERLGVGGLRS